MSQKDLFDDNKQPESYYKVTKNTNVIQDDKNEILNE